MKLTGHKTESVYRRYAIVCERDLKDGVEKLAKLNKSQSPDPPDKKKAVGEGMDNVVAFPRVG